MTLHVIGAGFGRTGTLSMQKALDNLGFGPTYHMNDVFKNPSHAQRWLDFGSTRTADWDDLFKKYSSTVDYPASCAWRELYDAHPDAKVILTVRDPDSWWESTATTIYPARTLYPRWLKKAVPFTQRWLDMVDDLVWFGLFDGQFLDKAHAIKVFNDHIAEVKAYCDPDRLLVFEVSQGWEPLCEFLDVAVPDEPFPHLNDSVALRRRLALVRWGTRLAPYTLAVTLGAAFLRRRRR